MARLLRSTALSLRIPQKLFIFPYRKFFSVNKSPKTPDIKTTISRFDSVVRRGDPAEMAVGWGQLKSRLDEILNSHKAPFLNQGAQLPQILIATPEVVSLPENMGNLSNMIKTGDGGGLADISATVVAELYRQGVNVHVVLPHYKRLFETQGKVSEERYRAMIRGVLEQDRIHFVNDVLFERAKRVYDESSPLDRLNLRKAIAFMRGSIYGLFPKISSENSDVVIHCNDWMTGLLPAAAKKWGIKSLFTFHNIFTEFVTPELSHKLGIDIEPFQEHLYFKFHPDSFKDGATHYSKNQVDLLTSGLFASDRINTVSPTFLREIVRGDFEDIQGERLIPKNLRKVIRARDREGRASGIINAPTVLANPRVDDLIYKNYTVDDVRKGKQKNKLQFQKQAGLKQTRRDPLFFWPHRLSSPQKGAELVIDMIPEILKRKPRAQFAVVANGQENLKQAFIRLEKKFPERVSYCEFTRELSQLGKAAADFILSPSLYEPCGIPQVEGPRYGTLPIVHRTGGLADTVEELDEETGNGFLFEDYTWEALMEATLAALEFFEQDEALRIGTLQRVMHESTQKINAKNTVNQYIELYEDILGKPVR